jgi:hypothetical protein
MFGFSSVRNWQGLGVDVWNATWKPFQIWVPVPRVKLLTAYFISVTVPFSLHGAKSASGPGPLHYRYSHSVGLIWTSDQPEAETATLNTQLSQQTDIHAPGGIRTRNRSKRPASDPSLRPRGHWKRWLCHIYCIYLLDIEVLTQIYGRLHPNICCI